MLSKPMLTVHEVADLLKVKEATVRGWINDRALRAIKLGRDWRVAVKDLEAFVNAHANRDAGEADDRAAAIGEPAVRGSGTPAGPNGCGPKAVRT